MTAPLCIVVKGFPRLSETFITRELEALQDAGLRFSIASLRQPSADAAKVNHRVDAALNYLPEYLHHEPSRAIGAFWAACKLPGFAQAWRMFRQDFPRDVSRNRARRFGQACVLAMEMPPGVRHVHAHFIHTPASVARYAATMRGLSFSVSAHAKDIWTTPDWDLAEKLEGAQFACVCNATGAKRLAGLAPSGKVVTWPHLVKPVSGPLRAPWSPDQPIRMLTVARAVPKKGLQSLVTALARLPPKPHWTWTYIGGGPLLKELRRMVEMHPFRDRLAIMGGQPHAVVLEAMRTHNVFVLAAGEAEDGDRDGRPNAVIEAMSAGLACVVSPAGGIPELLGDGVGLMPRNDPAQFAETIARLLEEPGDILRLAAAARMRAAELAKDGDAALAALTQALRKASGQ